MNAATRRESEISKLLRGVVIVIATAFMILPAYVNYELGPTKMGFNPVVSIAISLQLFAIGIVLFILAVGKERLMPKAQPE